MTLCDERSMSAESINPTKAMSKEFELLKAASARVNFLSFMGIELLDAGAGWTKMKLRFRPELLQTGITAWRSDL